MTVTRLTVTRLTKTYKKNYARSPDWIWKKSIGDFSTVPGSRSFDADTKDNQLFLSTENPVTPLTSKIKYANP